MAEDDSSLADLFSGARRAERYQEVDAVAAPATLPPVRNDAPGVMVQDRPRPCLLYTSPSPRDRS